MLFVIVVPEIASFAAVHFFGSATVVVVGGTILLCFTALMWCFLPVDAGNIATTKILMI